MTRTLTVLSAAIVLAACSPDAPPAGPTPDTSGGFDAQAWLAEAREVAVGAEGADLDDPGTDRMKTLAGELNAAADWRRACDTFADYDTGEMTYDPVPPGEGHWIRGTMEIEDVSDTEAVVAITCDFGAYQGSYALVHIDGATARVLTAPEFTASGRPDGPRTGTFSTPFLGEASEGTISTFARARGLGDCGLYITYALGDDLTVREVRERDCDSDVPDPLPPPDEWPVVYAAD